MSNPVKSTLDDIFGNSNALSDTAIASSLANHKKADRVTMDTNILHQVIKNTPKSLLDIEFKVQTALGTSGVTGSENPDLDTTKMTVIFAENTHMLEKIAPVVQEYDLLSATQILLVENTTEVHPPKKYGLKYDNIMKEIETLTLDQVKEYSGDVM